MGILTFHSGILWRPLYITSAVMLGLIAILAFVFPFLAAILSFCLICLWSRVPCMMSEYTKDLEVIDFFTVLLVLNVGLVWGMLFGVCNMLFSRIFGPMENLDYTIFDTSLFIPCAIASFIAHTYFGQSFLWSLYIFTIVRYGLSFILVIIMSPANIPGLIQYSLIGIPLAYLSNTLTAYFFGNSLTNLVKNGLHFDWRMIIIFAVVLGLFGISKLISKIPNPQQVTKKVREPISEEGEKP